MSASVLLAYISAALGLQVAIALTVAFLRRDRVVESLVSRPRVALPSPAAWDGWRVFRVARRVYEDRAHSLCSFHLEPVDGVPLSPFVPGQFLTVAVPISRDRTLTRCYSLSDGPNSESFRISVKRVLASVGRPELPAGVCSNHLHDRLQIGDVLSVKAPAGRFVVAPESTEPIVLIAGGIGITPLLCMLRGGLAAKPNRSVHLYYGVRQGAEHGFRKELEDLTSLHPSFHLIVVYSEPGPDDALGQDYQYAGNIDVDLLRRTLPAGRHCFYVCGPPAMLANLIPALGQWGVLPGDIHFEAFGPASLAAQPSSRAAAPRASRSFEVKFRRSARTITWDGTDANLLEFAERHHLRIESGCRTGLCGTCEVELISGSVHYAEVPDHTITPGSCLLCVGVPDSSLELEA